MVLIRAFLDEGKQVNHDSFEQERERNQMNSRADWILKWVLIIAVAFIAAVALTGCNTFEGAAGMVEGAGKDLRAMAVGTRRFLMGEDEEDSYGIANR